MVAAAAAAGYCSRTALPAAHLDSRGLLSPAKEAAEEAPKEAGLALLPWLLLAVLQPRMQYVVRLLHAASTDKAETVHGRIMSLKASCRACAPDRGPLGDLHPCHKQPEKSNGLPAVSPIWKGSTGCFAAGRAAESKDRKEAARRCGQQILHQHVLLNPN